MQSPNVIDVSAENFAVEVLDRSAQVPVLVDFWADWCNPCHMLMPILTGLAQEMNGAFVLARVNADEQQPLAMQFGVRSLPTVKLVRDGAVVDEFTGVLPEPQVRAFLAAHLDNGSDDVLAAARAAADAGAVDQALTQAEAAHREDPDNHRVTVGYLELLLLAGRFDDAEALLQNLPASEQVEDDTRRIAARIEFARQATASPPLAQLEQALAANPADSDAHFGAAAHQVMNGNYEQAMVHLFTVLQADRGFAGGAAQKSLLSVFQIAGDAPAVSDYRRRLSALLY